MSQSKAKDVEIWNALVQEAAKGVVDKESRNKGAVTLVGSGILSVGHLTLEALGYIKCSDKVFYCVADPVTERYIKDLRPDALDLYVLYDDDKERYITYMQMSEVILHEARKGFHVVGIFYGHPGVFVMPSHRALQIAEKEGMKARMLAAPSAEDCLFADLGIDPSYPGCQSFEATDLLLRKRQISSDLHVIVWQVGCVGNTGFRFKGYANEKLHILIEYLQKVYGDDYVITHYIGPQYPVCDAVKEKIKLSQFSDPTYRNKVTGVSTFYIPPKDARETDPEMAAQLGLKVRTSGQNAAPATRSIASYNERESKAVFDLQKWKLPKNYMFSVSSEISKYLTKASLNPIALRQTSRLTKHQREIIDSKHAGRIRMILKTSTEPDEATMVAKKIFTDGNFAAKYLAIMNAIDEHSTSFQIVDTWLKKNGYNCTAEEVQAAMEDLLKTSLYPWSNSYNFENLGKILYIDGISTPDAPLILWDYDKIQAANFENGTLTWSVNSGNKENAEISFQRKLTIDPNMDPTKIDGKDAQLVQVRGFVWDKDSSKPDKPNLNLEMTPVSIIGLTTFKGEYSLTIKGSSGDSSLVINVDEKTKTSSVTYEGKPVNKFQYESCTLKWTSADNSENATLNLLENFTTAGTFSLQIIGKIWTGAQPPADNNTEGHLHETNVLPWVGSYKSTADKAYGPEVKLEEVNGRVVLSVGGKGVEYTTGKNYVINWNLDNTNYEIQFFQTNKNEPKRFFGFKWKNGTSKPSKGNFSGVFDALGLTPWSAYYKTYKKVGDKFSHYLEFMLLGSSKENSLTISEKSVQGLQFNNPVLLWNHPNNEINGEITFTLKDNHPVKTFSGKVWNKNESRPDTNNINGKVDQNYLLSFSGQYYTYVKHGSKWDKGGPVLHITGAATQEKSVVTLDGAQVLDWQYTKPTMTWTSNENRYNAEITFYFPSQPHTEHVAADTVPRFAGKRWASGKSKPVENNWIGDQTPPSSSSANTGEKFPDIIIAFVIGLVSMGVIAILKMAFNNKLWFNAKSSVIDEADDIINVAENIEPDPTPPEPVTTTETETTTETTTEATTETITETTTETTTEVTTETTTEVTTETIETTEVVTEAEVVEVEVIAI